MRFRIKAKRWLEGTRWNYLNTPVLPSTLLEQFLKVDDWLLEFFLGWVETCHLLNFGEISVYVGTFLLFTRIVVT